MSETSGEEPKKGRWSVRVGSQSTIGKFDKAYKKFSNKKRFKLKAYRTKKK